jgi:hypothetical protein
VARALPRSALGGKDFLRRSALVGWDLLEPQQEADYRGQLVCCTPSACKTGSHHLCQLGRIGQRIGPTHPPPWTMDYWTPSPSRQRQPYAMHCYQVVVIKWRLVRAIFLVTANHQLRRREAGGGGGGELAPRRRQKHRTMLHGDYKAENILFKAGGSSSAADGGSQCGWLAGMVRAHSHHLNSIAAGKSSHLLVPILG